MPSESISKLELNEKSAGHAETKKESLSDVLKNRPYGFDFEAAAELLSNRRQVDYEGLLKESDVLYLGDSHYDYSIAEYIKDQVGLFKVNGVKTFAVEINPKDQTLLDELNKGDFSVLDKLDFSLGFGSKSVKENKEALIKDLVTNGIEIVGIARWVRPIGGDKVDYNVESEESAADIIEERIKQGKVVVFVGAEHGVFAKGDRRYTFVRSPDFLREKGIKITTIRFIGGMNAPWEDERSPIGYLRRASHARGLDDGLFYIDKSDSLFSSTKFNNDAVIHLPHKNFRSNEDRKSG